MCTSNTSCLNQIINEAPVTYVVGGICSVYQLILIVLMILRLRDMEISEHYFLFLMVLCGIGTCIFKLGTCGISFYIFTNYSDGGETRAKNFLYYYLIGGISYTNTVILIVYLVIQIWAISSDEEWGSLVKAILSTILFLVCLDFLLFGSVLAVYFVFYYTSSRGSFVYELVRPDYDNNALQNSLEVIDVNKGKYLVMSPVTYY